MAAKNIRVANPEATLFTCSFGFMGLDPFEVCTWTGTSILCCLKVDITYQIASVKRRSNLLGMIIKSNDLESKPREVGMLKGHPVYESRTKGGLCILSDYSGKPIGMAPHRAIARVVAQKREPSITYTGLEKGDWVDPSLIAWVLPKYEALTSQAISIWDSIH